MKFWNRRTDDSRLLSRIDALENRINLVEDQIRTGLWRALDVAYETALDHRDIRCIICGHSDKRSGYEILIDHCVFGGGKLERYRCPGCDCIFGPQKYLDMNDEFVGVDYQLLYMRYSEGETSENEIRTFHSLLPTRDRLYLDWGCGTQQKAFSKIRSDGYSGLWGFEPSMPQSGNFVVTQRSEISNGFDGIFSNNVIEHFRDPIAQFLDFHSILKADGKMAHSSPCYEYCYAFTRFHSIFLLGRSPHILAEHTGFQVADIIRDGEYINYVFAKVSPQ
jgi:hypothetical protein